MTLADWSLGPAVRVSEPWPAHDGRWYSPGGSYYGGSAPVHAGVPVTLQSALTSSCVFAGARLVGGIQAFLPFVLYDRLSDDERERATSDPLYRLLRDRPNEYQSGYDYRLMQGIRLFLCGNHFAEKLYTASGQLGELIPIDPDHVGVGWAPGYRRRRRIYEVSSAHDGRPRVVTADFMHHVHGITLDGLRGLGIVELMRQGIGIGLASEVHVARFFGIGGSHGLVFESPDAFRKEKHDQMVKNYEDSHGGVYRHHKPMFLYGGMKASKVTQTNREAQLDTLRDFQVADFCRASGIPLWLMQAQEKQTSWGTGMATADLAFAKYTMGYYNGAVEHAVRRDLISGDNQYGEFLLDALLRADAETRSKVYQAWIEAGMLTPNEGRVRENMRRRDDELGDRFRRSANVVLDEEQAMIEPPAARPNNSARRGTNGQSGRIHPAGVLS